MKRALSIIAVIVVFLLLLPLLCGHYAKVGLTGFIKHFNQAEKSHHLSITLKNYHSGWFSSKGTLLLNQAGHTKLFPISISHGPILICRSVNHGITIGVGLGCASGDLIVDQKSINAYAKRMHKKLHLVALKPLDMAHMAKVSFDGTVTITAKQIGPFSLLNTKQHQTFLTKNLVLDAKYSSSNDTANVTFKGDLRLLLKKKKLMDMDGFNLNSHMTFKKDKLSHIKGTIHVPSIKFYGKKSTNILTIDNFTLHNSSNIKQDKPSTINLKASIATIKATFPPHNHFKDTGTATIKGISLFVNSKKINKTLSVGKSKLSINSIVGHDTFPHQKKRDSNLVMNHYVLGFDTKDSDNKFTYTIHSSLGKLNFGKTKIANGLLNFTVSNIKTSLLTNIAQTAIAGVKSASKHHNHFSKSFVAKLKKLNYQLLKGGLNLSLAPFKATYNGSPINVTANATLTNLQNKVATSKGIKVKLIKARIEAPKEFLHGPKKVVTIAYHYPKMMIDGKPIGDMALSISWKALTEMEKHYAHSSRQQPAQSRRPRQPAGDTYSTNVPASYYKY